MVIEYYELAKKSYKVQKEVGRHSPVPLEPIDFIRRAKNLREIAKRCKKLRTKKERIACLNKEAWKVPAKEGK